MKRLHFHLPVNDLPTSTRFYSGFSAAEPAVLKCGYARWMLDDPRVNFAISPRGRVAGVDHPGIQVKSRTELDEVHARLKGAQAPMIEEGRTACCYAVSEKNRTDDPQGIHWETFFTTGESTEYGSDRVRPAAEKTKEAACCPPTCCAPRAA